MFLLDSSHVEDLQIGSAILGSGGGGDPAYAKWMLLHQIEKYGPIPIRSVSSPTKEDFVALLALMGAPLVSMEKVLCGDELESILDAIKQEANRPLTALMVGEIGGANAFTPLLIAGKRKLPVIDADLLGRAFPKLEMNSANLHGLDVCPVWMADAMGNLTCIREKDPKQIEQLAREVAITMGSSCAFSFAVGDGEFVKTHAVKGSISRALKLGAAIKGASDPFSALESLGGCFLGKGVIRDIDAAVKSAFLQGSVTLTTQTGDIQILYQNEYLFAVKEGRCLGATPDLLVLLEENSGLPIMSESLRFGLQARLFSLPAPDVWKSQSAQTLVGPECFGYKIEEGRLCAIS